MNVLVACERSGVVRRAFQKLGHKVSSCDLEQADDRSSDHYQGDIFDLLRARVGKFDAMIAHPPCTRLTVAGARWFKGREQEQADAVAFVEALWESGIPKIAIENPIGVLSTRSTLGKPTQIIQPWMFGHGETKATCLWLKGLPKLTPTNIVDGREARIHKMAPSAERSRLRSVTYQGIADAMAAQWGTL